MRIGYIILCRYASTRLHGKILREINQKPILQYIYERLRCIAAPENIIVATGNDKSNKPIIDYCTKNGIPHFLGEQDNVAKRFLDCAEAYRFDYAARINGDNLFVSPAIIRQMLPFVTADQYDFISNVKERTFPTGMSVEYVRTTFFHDIMDKINTSRYREHVTLYLYDHENEGNHYYYYNTICPDAKGRNFAIDTDEDFQFAGRLLAKTSSVHTNYDLCDWINMDK